MAGVPVYTLLFAPDYRPRLPHEYQFDLHSAAGQRALQRIAGFLQVHATKH